MVGSPKGYITHIAPETFSHHCTTELTDIFAMGITLFRACNYINNWDDVIRHLQSPREIIESGKLIHAIGFAPFIPLKLKRIIEKACAPINCNRYQSASEFRQGLERLSPNIDWIPMAQHSFEGTCVKTKALFSISIIQKKIDFLVEVKKNNRKLTADCKKFDNLEKACVYMFKYVSSSLFK